MRTPSVLLLQRHTYILQLCVQPHLLTPPFHIPTPNNKSTTTTRRLQEARPDPLGRRLRAPDPAQAAAAQGGRAAQKNARRAAKRAAAANAGGRGGGRGGGAGGGGARTRYDDEEGSSSGEAGQESDDEGSDGWGVPRGRAAAGAAARGGLGGGGRGGRGSGSLGGRSGSGAGGRGGSGAGGRGGGSGARQQTPPPAAPAAPWARPKGDGPKLHGGLGLMDDDYRLGSGSGGSDTEGADDSDG